MASVLLNKEFVHAIRGKTGLVGLHHNGGHYVVGFSSTHVKQVLRRVDINKPITLERHYVADISGEINHGLHRLGVDCKMKDVHVDLASLLTIDFRKEDEAANNLSSIEIQYDDFLMYPFKMGLGVVMPYDIVEENVDQIVFRSQVIDPCESFELFRNSLVDMNK